MPRNDADQLTVKAIVEIARGLGKTTIAEFVQDDETTQLLREYGVDMAQGYHLGRPVDSAEGLLPEAA
jgi:EAL domain-containing protein (putative c-di-GMP-specific phosphodiesterase class I)